ncbi:hypothetical protein [Halorarius halobius]|uniref:hypothetical protein n=1 Tax=Halorarius halobius TaxID=2962671 RepID=UPI0020CC1D64|nr:hypothetical protein [Halorarius halobius]
MDDGTAELKHVFSALCLGVLIVLSGCSPLTSDRPAGQEGPVTLSVNNSANVTHTFEVWVVDSELNNREVIIRKRGGEIDRASPGPGLSNYQLDGDYGFVTAIELPQYQSRFYRNYTLSPDEENQSSIDEFKDDSTVIVIIYRDNRVVALVTAHCDDDLVFVDVTMRPYGADTGYNCEPPG